MSKLLMIGSGSYYSTKDVEMGFYNGLKAAGHDVGLYLLDKRIGYAWEYHHMVWRRAGKPKDKPVNMHDIMYTACEDITQRAARYKADWVVAVAGRLLHVDVLHALRNVGIRTALIGTENPYDDEYYAQIAPLLTVLTVCERASVVVPLSCG